MATPQELFRRNRDRKVEEGIEQKEAQDLTTNQMIAGYRTLLWRNYFDRKTPRKDNPADSFLAADLYNTKDFDWIAKRETGNLPMLKYQGPDTTGIRGIGQVTAGGSGRSGWRALDNTRRLDPGTRMLGQNTGVGGSLFNPVRRVGLGVDNFLRRNIKF